MEDVQIVTVTPNKANITYHVRKWQDGMGEAMDDIIERLLQKRTRSERTIIYCRTISDCIDVHRYFRDKLGQNIHEPPGAPNLPQFRLVDIYCSCIHADTQEAILKSFMDLSGNLRVVIATIAFGLGLDCPDVRFVVHWGPPENIEAYLQETGRAGRDGLHADAILYYGPGQLRKDRVSELMIYYCNNTTECRRKILLQDFDGYKDINVGSQWRCSTCGTLLPATSVHIEHLHTGQERSLLSTVVYTRHFILFPSPQVHLLPNNSCTGITATSGFPPSTRRCEE